MIILTRKGASCPKRLPICSCEYPPFLQQFSIGEIALLTVTIAKGL